MASGSPRRRSRLPCGAGAASNAGGHDTEAAGALLAGDLLSDTQCLALRQRLLTGSEIDSSAAPGSDGLMLNWMDRTRGAQAVFKVC